MNGKAAAQTQPLSPMARVSLFLICLLEEMYSDSPFFSFYQFQGWVWQRGSTISYTRPCASSTGYLFSIHLAGASGGTAHVGHPISAALGIGSLATSIYRPIKCNHFILDIRKGDFYSNRKRKKKLRMKYAQRLPCLSWLDQPDFRQVFLLEQEAELQVNLNHYG